MGGYLVCRGGGRGAVDLDEHKARRIVGLLDDIKPGDSGLADRLPGVLHARGFECLDGLGFDMNMYMNNEHNVTELAVSDSAELRICPSGFWRKNSRQNRPQT